MTISYCVIWLFLYGEKDILMVKYSCKENEDLQEGNTNRRKNVAKSEAGFLIESHDKAKQIEDVMKEMVRMKVFCRRNKD